MVDQVAADGRTRADLAAGKSHPASFPRWLRVERAFRVALAVQARSTPIAMPSGDRRSPRTTAVLWSIAALAVIVLAWLQFERIRHRTAGGGSISQVTIELADIRFDFNQPSGAFRFTSYDSGSVRKPSGVTAQISVIGDRTRTELLRVGEDIPGTRYQIKSFEQGTLQGRDASKVTIVNKETGEEDVLLHRGMYDRGDMRAVLRCKWMQDGGERTCEVRKRIGETFTVPPEGGGTYKVIDIKGRGAVVERPDGTKQLLVSK